MRTLTIEATPHKSLFRKKNTHPDSHQKFYTQRWFLAVSVVVVLLVVFGLWTFFQVRSVMAAANSLQEEATVMQGYAKDQDLGAIQESIPEARKRLLLLEGKVQAFSWTQYIPWLGHYYQDSEHVFTAAESGLDGAEVLVRAITPYADVLGFKGTSDSKEASPTEDKVAELVLLMPTIIPALNEAVGHFAVVKSEVHDIDVNRYPETIGDYKPRALLSDVVSQIDALEQGMRDVQPILAVLPNILGAESPKNYILLFQNDKELRPTGGFITSVAYIKFNRGKFTISDTGDIYHIDTGKAYLPTPKPISLYLKVPQFNLRDTNFSPDFVESMEDFELYYNKSKSPAIDGVIALDTQFVEDLMKITGPISVPGYKEPFTAEPVNVNGTKVAQVVYQLELFAEKMGLSDKDRKSVLGDLMHEIIDKVLSDPASKWPDYLKMLLSASEEKHILLYFHDKDAQSLAEDRNMAGRIVSTDMATEDYLHVNDANLAGLKSNLYLQQKLKQDIRIADDGAVTKKLTITYTNTGTFDGWLNATARNYVRVYVPKGSKLIKSSGGEQRVTTTEDLGKTVFDNFLTIKPLASQTITFEYTLPFKLEDKHYEALIQKQSGSQNWTYTTSINGAEGQSVLLNKDQRVSMPF